MCLKQKSNVKEVERGSEATERANSSGRRANLRYPNPLEGYRGLSSKTYQLGNDQTELENRAGLPRESEKAFFFPASVSIWLIWFDLAQLRLSLG